MDLETFNRAIENYCRTKEDININNDYTIYQYLAEKNPELSEKLGTKVVIKKKLGTTNTITVIAAETSLFSFI